MAKKTTPPAAESSIPPVSEIPATPESPWYAQPDIDALQNSVDPEFGQVVKDVFGCWRAVKVLGRLLREKSDDGLDADERRGIGILLEGVENRLELAKDGIMDHAINQYC